MHDKESDQHNARFRFPKSRRLLQRHEFVLVQRRGRRFVLGPLIACVRKHSGTPTRIGITTSKRVGSAVTRNRIRRLTREAVRRLLLPAIPDGWEVVLIAQNDLPFAMAQTDIDDAIKRLIALLQTPAGPPQQPVAPQGAKRSPKS